MNVSEIPLAGPQSAFKPGARPRHDTETSEAFTSICRPKRPMAQGQRAERLSKIFVIETPDLVKFAKAFEAELQKGLTLHANPERMPSDCSLDMLDSYVVGMPNPRIRKIVYGLDFGGSTLRVVRLSLRGDGTFERDQRIHKDQSGENHLLSADTPGTVLFDHIAHYLKSMMIEFGDDARGIDYDVGFTFSFPCQYTALDSALLTRWVKGWNTGRNTSEPVEGRNVCGMLQEAFVRLGVPGMVRASTNDTVSCMVSCDYAKPAQYPPCRVGVIIGTGVNGCYWDPDAKKFGYEGSIINTELGAFDKNLPRNFVDAEVDADSGQIGVHPLEKMCSGAYIGEIARLAILKIFQTRSPEKVWIENSFTAESLMDCAADDTTDLSQAQRVVRDCWDEELGHEDLKDIQKICLAIMNRSATIMAAVITVLARATGELKRGVTCGVDGSLYLKNQIYRNALEAAFKNLLAEDERNLDLVASADGSGQGAALIASLAKE